MEIFREELDTLEARARTRMGPTAAADLRRELAAHLAASYEARREWGESPEAAREGALADVGALARAVPRRLSSDAVAFGAGIVLTLLTQVPLLMLKAGWPLPAPWTLFLATGLVALGVAGLSRGRWPWRGALLGGLASLPVGTVPTAIVMPESLGGGIRITPDLLAVWTVCISYFAAVSLAGHGLGLLARSRGAASLVRSEGAVAATLFAVGWWYLPQWATIFFAASSLGELLPLILFPTPLVFVAAALARGGERLPWRGALLGSGAALVAAALGASMRVSSQNALNEFVGTVLVGVLALAILIPASLAGARVGSRLRERVRG